MDSEIVARLEAAAEVGGEGVDDVLRRLLHLGRFSLAERFFGGATPVVKEIVAHLDEQLGVRNPGLHFVERASYVGFRREERPRRPTGARSQVIACVLLPVRADSVQVLLPIEPREVRLAPNMRDLTGVGHHGVGQLEVTARSSTDIDAMLDAFGEWLTSPRS